MIGTPLGASVGKPFDWLTTDVPMRFQCVHSTVPSKVRFDVMPWRTPRLALSGHLTVVIAVADAQPIVILIATVGAALYVRSELLCA